MKRLQWADALRGILILLVILGHSIQFAPGMDAESNHLWNMIYSFHMPAFMVVSGFVSYHIWGGEIAWRTAIYRKFLQLLIPFFLWSVISSAFSPTEMLSKLANDIIHPDTGFWFLWALFWISLIFILTDYISEKLHLKQEWCETAVAVALVGIMVLAEFRYFGFQFIAYYFMFYTAGYFYRKYEDYIPKNIVLICSSTVIWAILAWFSAPHRLPAFLEGVPLIPGSVLLYGYRFITAMTACYVLLALSPLILDAKNLFNQYFASLGKISLGIYVVHLLFCGELVRYLGAVIGTDMIWLPIIITFILATAISYSVVRLLSLNKYTAKYLLGKL